MPIPGPARRRRRSTILAVFLAATIVGFTSGLTAAAYSPNSGAYALYTGGSLDGLAGFQMLTALTPHAGYAIAHPGQLNPSFSGDFLGFGTEKGEQVSGCPAYYGSGWHVYVDGTLSGVCFCQSLETIAGGAQSQSFIVQRASGAGSCPGDTGPGWIVEWQRTELACISSLGFSTTDAITVGGENAGNYPGQAVAISYVQCQERPQGSHYFYWPSWSFSADPGYAVAEFGTRTSFKVTP